MVPTEPGFYWYREDNPHLFTDEWRVLEVKDISYRGAPRLGITLYEYGTLREYRVEEFTGEWGPTLGPPGEASGRAE